VQRSLGQPKIRHIHYANHLDANIFSYYANLLHKEYEKTVEELKLGECITAYRRIPVHLDKPDGPMKCNIHFANEVFQFIKNTPYSELLVLTLDITGFFDNLKHSILKHKWQNLLGSHNLPPNHYNVFRNITKFSYIDEIDIFETFKEKIIIQKKPKDGSKPTPIKRKKISKLKHLRNQEAIAFCTKKDFTKWSDRNQLIKNNKYTNQETKELRTKGIPQGSPISAVLANLYMLDFDKDINELVRQHGGLYRRYSDDIVLACPVELETTVQNVITQKLAELNLEAQADKTQSFLFERRNGTIQCLEKKQNDFFTNKRFSYLGFEFDGETALLKPSSLAKFYRRMKKSIRAAQFHAFRHTNKTTRGELFKNRLYKRFTYLGSQRKRRHDSVPKTDWGNYLAYANKANYIMEGSKIKRQVRKHWRIFHKLMEN
jgi:hypothetical protein